MTKIVIKKVNYIVTYVLLDAYDICKRNLLWKTSFKINVNPEAKCMCMSYFILKNRFFKWMFQLFNLNCIQLKYANNRILTCNFIFCFGFYSYDHLQLGANTPKNMI